MSIFSKTMSKAISDYRFLLRRNLNQVNRLMKLQQLNLRNPDIYQTDVALFEVGQAILADIKKTLLNNNARNQLYAYSGIQQFSEYLENYLNNYEIENGRVVHRTQKASRALLKAIQLISLSKESLTDRIKQELYECNQVIVEYGSKEQQALQLQTLTRQEEANPGFFVNVLTHLETMMTGGDAVAAPSVTAELRGVPHLQIHLLRLRDERGLRFLVHHQPPVR